MTRIVLEKNQLFIYLAALIMGLILGLTAPETGVRLEIAIWPLLGVLLYSTFTQVPLTHLQAAFRKPKLLCAAIVGNFILIPLIVACLLWLAPNDDAMRLGILLVLLVPCTDWFITFTHLGEGDTNGAIAFSPISLLMQIFLLPVYLWIFLGNQITISLAQGDMIWAFIGLIVVPLFLAWLSQIWAANHVSGEQFITILGWLPVILLSAVIFIITASQVAVVFEAVDLLGNLLLIFVLFLIIAAAIAKLLSRLFQLSFSQGRVLAFSFATRNSFVMLPLALALPGGYELAAVVIVFQSLIELIGMMVFLWWVPKRLFPSTGN